MSSFYPLDFTKTHYLSIMSYNYQLNGLTVDDVTGRIDYSRLQIASVNEASLYEPSSFAPVGGTTDADLAHYGVRACNFLLSAAARRNTAGVTP